MDAYALRNLSLVAQGGLALGRAGQHSEGANEGYLLVHGVVARAMSGRAAHISEALTEALRPRSHTLTAKE